LLEPARDLYAPSAARILSSSSSMLVARVLQIRLATA
jgi:hypothetical protein